MLSRLSPGSSLWQAFVSSKLLVFTVLLLCSPVSSQVDPPTIAEKGVSVYPFDFSQVTLNTGRWQDNQARTISYLHYVDVQRMLYVFRANHKISTNGATSNGGWDDPTFPFRSHFQGHLLSAWAQCYGQLGDTTCKSQATTMTAALVQCQANNAAAGFATGYLSGFPESDFTALEGGTLTNGNVPWYVIHKIMAGLLDVWVHIGDSNAQTALLALAGWVDTRTAKLSYSTMQNVLNTEFGGMPEVLTDLYFQTGNSKWLTTAARFNMASVLTPLANNQDQLNGLHANTQIPKWIGALRQYKATGNATYLSIARDAWTITTSAHAYAMGGISEAEHFHAANAISSYLDADTMEHCDSYNMLKLTRELFTVDQSTTAYFDYYERTLMNHVIGSQDPQSSHGATTYFSSLNPGSLRGLGPAWGGGTWSTDYDSFWCCHGTSLEVNTAHGDSIYFYDDDDIYVNLFHSSTVKWAAKNVAITQTTSYPITASSTLQVTGAGTWNMKIRIPAWTSGASILVNGQAVSGTSITPGKYATISRTWASGDTVTICLPMSFQTIVANDNHSVAAVAYGPVILTGDYTSSFTAMPSLSLNTLKRTSTSALQFSGTSGGQSVNLIAFFEAQHVYSNTYWTTSGSVPTAPSNTCSSS
ncbi:MAG: hypothetical protein M1822_004288 [Bathelium mastoideum]|nr:MAG: hypothetical protein M1822_004288 [Bathelium mastoideum]